MSAATHAPPDHADLLTPSVLVVDDERQIHSSLRLRLGGFCRLTCQSDPQQALAGLREGQFDLCFVDVHMPGMDGLTFIEAAKAIDPALGYVILTGYDSEENLRRAIPLQVLEFLSKPLPDRSGFEERVPDWVARTRARRREIAAARDSGVLLRDVEIARVEREVEFTASAHARDALLQTATLLTTTHALLFTARHALESMVSTDPHLDDARHGVREASRHAEAAAAIAEGYFASAYADREASPALFDTCLRHAIAISRRLAQADQRPLHVDCAPLGRDAVLADLTGMDLLLMLVPVLLQAFDLAPAGDTMRISCEQITRLDQAFEHRAYRGFLWVNRLDAAGGAPGVLLVIRSHAPALTEENAKAWLLGRADPPLRHPCLGLLRGVQTSRGFLGLATRPDEDKFVLLLGLRL